MEPSGGADEITALLQGNTAPCLSVFQLLQVGEVAVDEGGVGQWQRCSAGCSSGE
jgi:hypothetical protein